MNDGDDAMTVAYAMRCVCAVGCAYATRRLRDDDDDNGTGATVGRDECGQDKISCVG